MSYTEIKNKPVKVRKRHRCEWCADPIEIGDAAQYRAYVFNGDFIHDWMHPECHQAMLDYPDQAELNDGWTKGDFSRGSISNES